MRRAFVALSLACLAPATGAEAQEIWLGPNIACPVPAGDVGVDRLGGDAGLTLDLMATPHVGIGVDVAYHYWPASTAYMNAYDRYLRGWFQTFDNPTWAISAVQYSGHLKLVGPTIYRCSPWVQVGAGRYGLDWRLGAPNWEGSPVVVVRGGPERNVSAPGWQGAIGLDFRASSGFVVGLNAAYQNVAPGNLPNVWGTKVEIPEFSAFTLGAHIRFRIWRERSG